jgi:thiol:disulfide interchange protein DsbC
MAKNYTMLRKLFVIAITLYAVNGLAAESAKPDLSQLEAVLGGEKPDSVNPTGIPGLYEVVMKSQILYLSQDGRFAIQGDLMDLKARNNLTQTRLDNLRAKAVSAVDEDKMIIFAPAGPAKHTVTVFTDIDCGYCRKFHREIADYNQNGIKVRYLLYPRTGISSDSYNKAVSVWCAQDRQEALTRAKRGETIEQKSCPNPVKEEYELGRSLGLQGTPTIILENGQMLPGYVSAADLAKMLDKAGLAN